MNWITSCFRALIPMLYSCLLPVFAHAQATNLGTPGFTWEFSELLSNGNNAASRSPLHSGFPKTQVRQGLGVQDSASIDLPSTLQTELKHFRVYSNPTGTSFFADSTSPLPDDLVRPDDGPIEENAKVGARTMLQIDQVFRKDSADAELNFKITKGMLELRGVEDNDPPPGELTAAVLFELLLYEDISCDGLDATQCFDKINNGSSYQNATIHETRGIQLEGRPGNYDAPFIYSWANYEEDRVGDTVVTRPREPLQWSVTEGGRQEPFIKYELASPYVMPADLAAIDVGEEFVIRYKVETRARDLIQFDSRAKAFGRDPLDPDSGPEMTYEGLTPLGTSLFPDLVDTATAPVILSPAAIIGSDLQTFDENCCGFEKMIDQSGLEKEFESGSTLFDEYFFDSTLADAMFDNNWTSSSTSEQPQVGFVDFDLGDTYVVDRVVLWNRSAENVDVLFSDEEDGEFVSAGNFDLPNHRNFLSVQGAILELDEEVEARYLRLQVNSAHELFTLPPDRVFTDVSIGEVAVSAMTSANRAFCDLEGDGVCNAEDIDRLNVFIAGGSEESLYDLNRDGIVNEDDREFMLTELMDAKPGDGDLDGVVDFADFLNVSKNFGGNGGWADGDFSGDRIIGFPDFLLLSQYFGEGARVESVPEPSSVISFTLGLIIFTQRRVRSRRHGDEALR